MFENSELNSLPHSLPQAKIGTSSLSPLAKNFQEILANKDKAFALLTQLENRLGGLLRPISESTSTTEPEAEKEKATSAIVEFTAKHASDLQYLTFRIGRILDRLEI